jgi:hypothetical protein
MSAAALLFAAVLGVVCLSIVPPPALLQSLVNASATWLLPRSYDDGVRGQLTKSLSTYVEFALAGKMAATVEAHGDRDEVARIDYAIRRAQLRTLTHQQLDYAPRDWPVLVSGIGVCDQVNAAVCQILAHSFRHAQLYALVDPQTKLSHHTVGRVWSDRRHEWLYFDAFTDRPLVYHLVNGKAEYLNRPEITYAGRKPPLFFLYDYPGFVLNEYPATYPQYMLSRIGEGAKRVAHDTGAKMSAAMQSMGTSARTKLASLSSLFRRKQAPPQVAKATPPSTGSVAPPPPPPPPAAAPAPPPKLDAAVYARVASAYVRARAEDILGDRAKAKERYKSIAADPGGARDEDAALLQEAARQFGSEL